MINENGLCSPERIGYYEKFKSCLNLKELKYIATEYNKFSKNDDKIETNVSNPIDLLQQIEQKFKCTEKNHYQCLESNNILKMNTKMKSLLSRFRPTISKLLLYNSPINTNHITEVLQQYEKKYKSFSYLGTFPLDFNEISRTEHKKCVIHQTDVCKFRLNSLREEKKNQFAITVNLDDHYSPGSHWVCLYGNIDESDPRYGLWYFDSYGNAPPKNVQNFVKKLQFDIKIPYYVNTTQYQFNSNECGIFCILFIVICLENRKNIFKVLQMKFKNPLIVEKQISSYRSKIFNTTDKSI